MIRWQFCPVTPAPWPSPTWLPVCPSPASPWGHPVPEASDSGPQAGQCGQRSTPGAPGVALPTSEGDHIQSRAEQDQPQACSHQDWHPGSLPLLSPACMQVTGLQLLCRATCLLLGIMNPCQDALGPTWMSGPPRQARRSLLERDSMGTVSQGDAGEETGRSRRGERKRSCVSPPRTTASLAPWSSLHPVQAGPSPHTHCATQI